MPKHSDLEETKVGDKVRVTKIRGFEVSIEGSTYIVIGQSRADFLAALERALIEPPIEAIGDPFVYTRIDDADGSPFVTAQVVSPQGTGWQRRVTFRADAVGMIWDDHDIVLSVRPVPKTPPPEIAGGGGGMPDVARAPEPWTDPDNEDTDDFEDPAKLFSDEDGAPHYTLSPGGA